MKEEQNVGKRTVARKILPIAVTMAAILLALALPVLSWFARGKQLLAYAPITSPEALYIGAGHRDTVNGTFEDIRYLYFNGIDANDADGWSDYVFCVYGTAISGFNLQLAFTTNNQFEYEVYVASESPTPTANTLVDYQAHDEEQTHYYYEIDQEVNSGNPVAGSFLNLDAVEYANNDLYLANNSRHASAYGLYGNVNRFAEALYWQTDSPIAGDSTGEFVVYFILRVKTNGKTSNDRETDILCISAKSYTVVEQGEG